MKPTAYMKLAITLASASRMLSPPNPWVGCVIVKSGQIIGKGATIGPNKSQSGTHAETLALREAGEKAMGATCYVTLEPCSHYGRTPPCAKLLIESGVEKVYVALQDPDLRVRGKGISMLRESGIEVIVGLNEKEAKEQLTPYLHHRETHTPYVCLKVASSIDGCIAAKDNSSKWITSASSRNSVHKLRAQSGAIIIGASTAKVDTPSLTVRELDEAFSAPIRVILDSKGITPSKGPLFDLSLAPTWIFTTENAPQEIIDSWESKGVKVSIVSSSNEGVDLKEVLNLLGKASILQVLVEGGGKLLGSFVQQDLYQKLYVFIGPKFLGDGVRSFSGLSVPSINLSPKVRLASVTQYDTDVCLEYDHLSPAKEIA